MFNAQIHVKYELKITKKISVVLNVINRHFNRYDTPMKNIYVHIQVVLVKHLQSDTKFEGLFASSTYCL